MRRKLFLMSQVLGEPQDQQQMPPATAQAPARHGEGSDCLLTGWPAACESPSPEHVEPHLGITGRTYYERKEAGSGTVA